MMVYDDGVVAPRSFACPVVVGGGQTGTPPFFGRAACAPHEASII